MWCDREGNDREGVEACWRMVDAQPSGQPSCGTPDQRGAKKGSVLSAQVHCLPRHHFPDQEASIPPSSPLSAPYFHIAPLPLIISRWTKHIDPRGFALAPSSPLRTMTINVVFCWLPWQLKTQIPKLSWAQPTFSDRRPRGSLFVSAVSVELEQLDPGSQGLKPEGSDLGFKRCLHSPFTPSANAGELFV